MILVFMKNFFVFFSFFFFSNAATETFLCSPCIPQCVSHPDHHHVFLLLEDVAVVVVCEKS